MHNPLYRDGLLGDKEGETPWVSQEVMVRGLCAHKARVWTHGSPEGRREGPQQSCCRDLGANRRWERSRNKRGGGAHGKNVLLESGQKRSQRSREAAGRRAEAPEGMA